MTEKGGRNNAEKWVRTRKEAELGHNNQTTWRQQNERTHRNPVQALRLQRNHGMG